MQAAKEIGWGIKVGAKLGKFNIADSEFRSRHRLRNSMVVHQGGGSKVREDTLRMNAA